MDFNIQCECGKTFTLTEGAAGTALICACGREVRVPSFTDLRVRAGLKWTPKTGQSNKLLLAVQERGKHEAETEVA